MADYLDIDKITEERAKAIQQSLKPITNEELKALGAELFPLQDNPWREKYFHFIEENAGETFYHAKTNYRVQIIYCRAKEQGMWFMPGTGMGPLQAKGLKVLKDAIDKR